MLVAEPQAEARVLVAWLQAEAEALVAELQAEAWALVELLREEGLMSKRVARQGLPPLVELGVVLIQWLAVLELRLAQDLAVLVTVEVESLEKRQRVFQRRSVRARLADSWRQ